MASDLELKMKYLGYKHSTPEKTGMKNFEIECFQFFNRNNISKIDIDMNNLYKLDLSDVRKLAEKFYKIHNFELRNINQLSINEAKNASSEMQKSSTVYDAYEYLNSKLKSKSPYELDIELINGHSMVGEIIKPLIIVPSEQGVTATNRKIYFDRIMLGKKLSLLSTATLVHEIAHSQQEQLIGYSENYLNKEIISIFLEKVCAYELDPSLELLNISSRKRMQDTYEKYKKSNSKESSQEDKIQSALYVQGTLYASKLFDMYLNERKPKNREKYLKDIQSVFNGELKVEDMLKNRGIRFSQCVDRALIHRQLYGYEIKQQPSVQNLVTKLAIETIGEQGDTALIDGIKAHMDSHEKILNNYENEQIKIDGE